ncbi:MAG: RimJ/RimL family protein N-acetyltransferase [Verrucomicrobiales bacterium]|jgi:RimJ/RimL family protein N-acetyltransferase
MVNVRAARPSDIDALLTLDTKLFIEDAGKHAPLMAAAEIELATTRLTLEPLRETHAAEMASVLSDPEVYEFTGGSAPTLDDLTRRYRSQIEGPIDGGEAWRNWILRDTETGRAAGFLQATIVGDEADIAWLVGRDFQGRGYAVEASAAMGAWLSSTEVGRITAHVHPEHEKSQRVAAAIGLTRTDRVDEHGEEVWDSRL